MADDKNLRGVYETLKKEGYTPPEYSEFVKDMQDDGNLRGVHKTLTQAGYTPPEFNQFKSDMFGIQEATAPSLRADSVTDDRGGFTPPADSSTSAAPAEPSLRSDTGQAAHGAVAGPTRADVVVPESSITGPKRADMNSNAAPAVSIEEHAARRLAPSPYQTILNDILPTDESIKARNEAIARRAADNFANGQTIDADPLGMKLATRQQEVNQANAVAQAMGAPARRSLDMADRLSRGDEAREYDRWEKATRQQQRNQLEEAEQALEAAWEERMKTIDQDIAQVKEAIKKRQAVVDKERGPRAFVADMGATAHWDEELMNLNRHLDILEETKHRYERGKDSKDKNWLWNTWYGIADGSVELIKNPLGLKGAADSMAVYRVNEKARRGEPLTEAEQQLLDAYGLKMQTEQYAQPLSAAYQIGGGVPAVVEMAAEFGLAPGAGMARSAWGAAAGASMKQFDKALVRAMGKSIVEGMSISSTTQLGKNIKSALDRTMSAPVYNDKGELAGFEGESLIESLLKTGFQSTASNAVFLVHSPLAKSVYAKSARQSGEKAAKSGTSFAERHPKVAGGFDRIGRWIEGFNGGKSRVIPFSNPVDGFIKMKASEVAPILMGDGEWEDWADPEQNAMLIGQLLTMEFTSGAYGSARAGINRMSAKSRMRKAYQTARDAFKDAKEPDEAIGTYMRSMLESSDGKLARELGEYRALALKNLSDKAVDAHPSLRPDAEQTAAQNSPDAPLTAAQADALIDLARATYGYLGVQSPRLGNDDVYRKSMDFYSRTNGKVWKDVRDDMNSLLHTTEYEALEKAYVDAASEQVVDAQGNPVPLERRRREAAMEYRYAVEEASREFFGMESVDDVGEVQESVRRFINNRVGEWHDYDELLYRIDTSKDMSREQKEAAKAFLFAERRMAGSEQLLADRTAEAKREQARQIDERTHTDGFVHEVTLRDGRTVFVKSGTLVTHEAPGADSKVVREVDYDKSHSTIVVREPETGKTKMIDPHDIAEVAAPVEAKAMLEEIAGETERAFHDEYTAQMNGDAELAAGSEYEVLLDNGSFEKARVVDVEPSLRSDTEQAEAPAGDAPAERMVVLEFSDGSRQSVPEKDVAANVRYAEYERYRQKRLAEGSDGQPEPTEKPEPDESANNGHAAISAPAPTPVSAPAASPAPTSAEVAAGDIIRIGGKDAHVADMRDGIATVWTTDKLNENSYTDRDTPGYYTSLNRSELDSMADRDADGNIIGTRADREAVDGLESNTQEIAPQVEAPSERNYVKNSEGSDDFGYIDISKANALGTGKAAPIRLQSGTDNFGRKHMEKHLPQLKANGYDSVEEFVEDVAGGYTEIRQGNLYTDPATGETKETYLLVKPLPKEQGSKGGVLYIECVPDGDVYVINSGGVFKNSYINRRKELWNASTEHSTTSGESQDFPPAQNKPESDGVSALSRSSFDGKVTNSASDKQENSAESLPRAIDRLPRDTQGDPIWDAPEVDAPTTWAALNEEVGSKDRVSNMLVKQQQYIADEINKLAKKEPQYKEPAAKGDINAMLRAESAARDKYRREHEAWEADMAELQRRAAHWRKVAETEREAERQEQERRQAEADELRRRAQESERREAEQREAERERSRIEHERQAEEDRRYFEANRERIKAEQRQAEEAEQRRLAERENLTEEERLAWEAEKRSFDKKLREVAEEVRDSEAALDILRDTSPQSIDEVAAMLLSSNKVVWKSEYGTNGTRVITGADAYSGLGESERRKLMGLWAARDKGGISIDKLAEDKFRELCQEFGIPYDNAEARDALIDMIRTSATRGSITNYIAERRMEQARRRAELERQYEEAQIEQSEREGGAALRSHTEQPEGIDNESVKQLGYALPDEEVPFHRGGQREADAEVYEAGVGLLKSAGVPVVEVGNTEAQAVLDNHGKDTQLMGSRTDRKMATVAEHYAGRELDANTQAVVDVFSGRRDNVAIEVERPDGKRRVVMRQGKEQKAGTKHSLFRHFETRSNYVTADDIAMVPEIIAKGERIADGKRVAYEYVAEDGTRLKVTTEVQDNVRERFTNLISNRKPQAPETQVPFGDTQSSAGVTDAEAGGRKPQNSDYRQAHNGNTQLSAQTSESEGSDAKVGNNSHSDKGNDRKFLRTPSGEVYGWTVGGKVYLNRDAMNPETPVHEYTHLWDRMIREQNSKLWERGKELLKQTELWREVENDPNYADIRGDEDAIASEVHSRLTGRDGARLLREMLDRAGQQGYVARAQATDLVGKIRQWMGDMFSALKGTLEKWSGKELKALTLEDFNKLTLRDLARGVDPRKEGGSNGPVQLSAAMARGREDFEAMRERVVKERGIVMPGLNEAEVRIVDVPRHDFEGDKPIAAARKWAKENIVGEHTLIDSNGNEVPYTISGKSIDKYLSETAIGKSSNMGVHLAALKKLPDIIKESIEAEIHPDYTKNDRASRSVENAINPDNLIHRFYGAALIDGQIHRVKTTIIENGVVQKNKPHSYEVTAVELISDTESQPDNHGRIRRPRFSEEQHGAERLQNKNLRAAKLLKGVEKSYDSGVKLLEASENSAPITSFADDSFRSPNGTSIHEDGTEYAGRIAVTEEQVNTEPTEGQKKAGNYKMEHRRIDGLKISIENPKGSMRRGTDANGTTWETRMNNDYGYIRGTTGVDGDKIDVFLSDNPAEGDVYVVDQYNKDGSFDEHKVMYGFKSAKEAEAAYLSNYSADWANDRKIVVSGVSRGEFRKWLDASSRKTKPFAEYADIKKNDSPGFIEAVKTLYEKGKDVAARLFNRSFFDVARTPGFMKNLGLKGERFTIRFGVISRHFGKDSDHKLPVEIWEQLPQALQTPFAITRHFERNGDAIKSKGFRIYTTLKHNDKYIIVGADVKNVGRDLDINAIETAFAITKPSELEEVIFTSKNITPDQQSLLDGRNSRQYPADRELSGDKVNTLSSDKQGNGENSSENVVREPAAERRSRKVAGVSLFDRRADEGLQGSLFDDVPADVEPSRSLVERAMDVAHARDADRANGVIEGYAERYMEYADGMERRDQRMAELEQEIEQRRAAGEDTLEAETELEALRNEAALEDSSMDEHQAEAVAQLGEFYRRLGNTPEDADRMAIDRAKQTRAEVEIRRAQLASRRRLEEDNASLRSRTEQAPQAESRGNDTEGAPVEAVVTTAGGDRIGVTSMGALPKLKEGDFALVERRFIADGMFTFDGKQRIESVDDVAYIFRKLEDFAQEHSFVVMQRADGSFKVVHTGMGNAVSTMVDLGAVRAAYEAFGADKVWFVHNHPSGTLEFSRADESLIRKIQAAFAGDVSDVDAIIINTRSGKYITYNEREKGNTTNSSSESEVGVELFGNKRFADDYNPDGLARISNSASIADYVAQLRLGDGVKSGYLILDNSNKVMANIVINGEPKTGELAREMVGATLRYGGKRVVRYSNGDISDSRSLSGSELMELKNRVQRISMDEVSLLDNVDMRGGLHDGGNYSSAFDNGLLFDSEAAYGSEAGKNIRAGIEAMKRIANGEEEVDNAMVRPDLENYGGTNGITFVFGKTGNAEKVYKGGYGLSHIGAKHGPESLRQILDVIASGHIERYVDSNKTVILSNGEYEAVLALTRNGQRQSWLLTGWDKITTGENGKVSASTVSTQANPTFSREDLGAVVNDAKLQQFFERASSRGSKNSENFVNDYDAGESYGSEAERAEKIRRLKPIEVQPNSMNREELKTVFSKLPEVRKDGKEIRFFNSAFKKIYKEGGLFGQVIPVLDKVLEQSVLAYSEADNLGGTIRPDGTMHKAHPNTLSFDNYIGKVEIDGQDYYVRITIQHDRGNRNGMHSCFVTEVGLYNNTDVQTTSTEIPRVKPNNTGIVDAKLQQFFERASSRGSKNSENFVNDPGTPAAAGGGAGPMSAKERVMAYMLELDRKAHERGEVRNAGMAALGKMSRRVGKAMRLQQQYDAALLADVAGIARSMMNAGLIDSRSRLEVSRTMAAMRSAVSDTDIKECARRLMNVAASSQLRILSDNFEKLVRIKARKKDAHGVSVAGSLDFAGQEMLEAFNEGRGMSSVEPLGDRINEIENRLETADGNSKEILQARRLGFELATRYKELVSTTVDNELELKSQLEYHKGTWKECANEAERRDYREKKAALEENLRDEQMKAADALRELTDIIFDQTSEARERLIEFRRTQDEHRNAIYHNVNSDLEGRAMRLNQRKLTKFDHSLNSFLGARLLLKPLGTFEQMMREFGRNSINGEGYLFDRFVRGWQECRDKQFKQQQEIEASLDEQARTILGGNVTRWSDIYKLSNKKAGTLTWSEGKHMEEHDVTEGQLVYIYMVNKMPDGRMKLRHMGIDEAKVNEIKARIDPKLKALADWMQQVKLPELREVFNDTHIRVFGSSMAEIEDYFPLHILKGSRLRNVVIDENGIEPSTPNTIVGAIRNRTKNACSLDILNCDAFSVMLDHVRTMTEWNNFAQYNKDLGTLLSYNGFRNKVSNMRTVYGSGDKFLENFEKHVMLAGGSHKPKTDDTNKSVMNLMKLGTASCIAFRINTAIKQILSAPAFNSEAKADDMAYCTLNSAGSVKWAMQNLPAFERRWKDRLAGNEILRDSDADWDWTNKKWFKTLQRMGITPNAAVDAYTCAIGARAVYRTKLRNYQKEGFDRATAHKKACSDAEIAFNLSQQSSENIYLSTMQNERNFLTSVFTVFRNSPMSYARQTYQSARELYNSLQPGGKERQLAFETKKLMREGLTQEQADYAAQKRYYRNLGRNVFKFFNYAALLPSLWAWSLSGMWYSIFGDDPKKKLQHATDALMRGCTFGWSEGFIGGGTLPDLFFDGLLKGEWHFDQDTMPAASMIVDCFKLAARGKKEQLIQQAVNTVVSVGIGANPQVLEDVVLAGIDLFTNEKDWRNYAIMAMRIIQAPQSQIDQVYLDKIGMSAAEAKAASPAELAERYAIYKMRRQSLAGLMITDAQRRDAMREDYQGRFEKIAKGLHLQKSESEVLETLEKARAHEAEFSEKSKRARKQSYVAMAEVEREKARDFGHQMWSAYKGGMDTISEEWLRALDGTTAAKAAEDLTRYRVLLALVLECGSAREARRYTAELNALNSKYGAMKHKRLSRR